MKNNGITLITLVITIIILLILSSIMINLSIGENNLFEQAKDAKKSYENAQMQEIDSIINIEE